MSGIAVGFGKPNRSHVDAMLRSIAHRGSHIAGVQWAGSAVLGQNYLKADLGGSDTDLAVPVARAGGGGAGPFICYDGQIGNVNRLAEQFGIEDGACKEERLLLRLYEKYGPKMTDYLTDAIFSLVISDGEHFFAARDILGIKTLFYTRKDDTLYLCSELKGIAAISMDVEEFPAAHWCDGAGECTPFSSLPTTPPPLVEKDVDTIAVDVRDIIQRSMEARVDFSRPTAALLSGGMDSSVISYLGSTMYREAKGNGSKLTTFSIGVGESSDIQSARIMAEHIGSDHHELLIELDDLLAVLPEVVYHLENFDPSLVRSAASNYLISRYAKEHGFEVLLSGEGGDEIFCGYMYLKQFPPEELVMKQIECLGFLHNNASLRLDRMNLCNSVKVVAPLISGELLEYAFSIPPELKQKPERDEKIEKWIFRKAYEDQLPKEITWRLKQEFSQGSGSAAVLPDYFEKKIGDAELAEAQKEYPIIRSKEELYYFRLFTNHFGSDKAIATVGQWLLL